MIMMEARRILDNTGGFTMTTHGVRRLLSNTHRQTGIAGSTEMFHGPDSGGFAVGAIQGDWLVIEPHLLDEDEIFYNIVCNLYEEFPECALGAWLSPDGYIVFDPILINPDFNESIEIAQTNEQLAIWDFRNSETVFLSDLEKETTLANE